MNNDKMSDSKGGCNLLLTWLQGGMYPVRKTFVSNLNLSTISVPISDLPLTT